ncbi:hypothetical protein KFE25_000358 [Diacronema lutheri]|uniref:CRAL-TRIO domain-containing protein n=1 Tax=Diacronema lutheri TaxID=2081491 RepID=A0A8J5XRF4_DIALT|nr:hypothetical protein KFE25_000358 [Diacronema lutheri]
MAVLVASVGARVRERTQACALPTQRLRLAELARQCPPPNAWQMGGERVRPMDMARFMRVYGWSVERAKAVLLEDYAWRKANRPRALRQERDTPAAARQGAWRAPRDALGRPLRTKDGLPVTTVTTRAWRPHAYGRAQNVKHVSFFMEEMVRAMPPGVEGAAMLLDMGGFKPGLLFPYVKDGVDCCQRHYPCRLGAIIAFNLPPYFPAIWRVVQPWFNADIRSKIAFAPRHVKDHMAALAWYDRTRAGRTRSVAGFFACWAPVATAPTAVDARLSSGS